MAMEIGRDETRNVDIHRAGGLLVHEPSLTMPPFNAVYGLWVFAYRDNVEMARCSAPKPRCFRFYGLSQAVEGEGWYWNGNGTSKIKPGDCVVSTPGFVQDYAAGAGGLFEDAVCFTGPLADNLFRCGVVRDGVFRLGGGRRLHAFFELVDAPSRDAQIRLNVLLLRLLTDIYLESRRLDAGAGRGRLDALLEEIAADPAKWWSLDAMAEACALSVSRFRAVFSKRTGMSPKAYVDRIKMGEAVKLLADTGLPVAEIARRLGYLDPYHFSRRFKALMGMSPRGYRERYLLG